MTQSFSELIKSLREKASLTQKQLADRSGASLGAIRDYEQGAKLPLLATAFRLAEALGVSCEVFRESIKEHANEEEGHTKPTRKLKPKRKGPASSKRKGATS